MLTFIRDHAYKLGGVAVSSRSCRIIATASRFVTIELKGRKEFNEEDCFETVLVGDLVGTRLDEVAWSYRRIAGCEIPSVLDSTREEMTEQIAMASKLHDGDLIGTVVVTLSQGSDRAPIAIEPADIKLGAACAAFEIEVKKIVKALVDATGAEFGGVGLSLDGVTSDTLENAMREYIEIGVRLVAVDYDVEATSIIIKCELYYTAKYLKVEKPIVRTRRCEVVRTRREAKVVRTRREVIRRHRR